MVEAFLREQDDADAERERVARVQPPQLVTVLSSGLSQQIAELREAGLIVGRKEGKQVFYRLADPRVETFTLTLHGLFCKEQVAPGATS